MSETTQVSERATQVESTPTQREWVDRTIWTERMLAALGNGVNGDKRFSHCCRMPSSPLWDASP